MELRNSRQRRSSSLSELLTSATDEDILVSQILLDLRHLMSLSESLKGFNWGCTKRRSCYVPPSPTKEKNTIMEAQKGRTTFSPDTPLAFSPSESDEKSGKQCCSKKSSRKRTREDYVGMIEGLAQKKELLRGEVEAVKKYYDKLKAYNLELKAMKQEAINACKRKEEEPQMELSLGLNLGTELTQKYRGDDVPHCQPLIRDPTAQTPSGPITAHLQTSNNGPDPGPFGIDLNFPAQEEAFDVDSSEPLDVIDDRRARFAEARRRRRAVMKGKSMRNGLSYKICQRPDSNETLIL